MIANIICLFVNILTNFILPKFLSIESYAEIKTYALYLTYAGFFSLGYNDGMYLKYGGKSLKDLDKSDLIDNINNYFFLILIMNICVLVIGIICKSFILCAFSFGLLTYNLLGYLKSFYQSIGEFKLYGLSLNIEKIGIFIGNVILLFIFHSDNYTYYISLQIIVGMITVVLLYNYLMHRIKFKKKVNISFKVIKENILTGFVLMLGNFTSGFFTGIDRWFIKILMNAQSFAIYAFSVSIENLVNVFISLITISLYNHICKNNENREIFNIKKYILLWGTLLIAVGFPIKYILENFLENYINASMIIFILLAAQVFYSMINGIYVNLYKVERKQNYYMKQMIVMIGNSIIMNFILYWIFRNMQYIAIVTFITAGIWFFWCEFKNKNIKFTMKEYLFILFILIGYFIFAYKLTPICGCVMYICEYLLLAIIFMKKEIIYLVNAIKEIVLDKIIKKKKYS